jgi:cytochrome c oxidase subunit 3
MTTSDSHHEMPEASHSPFLGHHFSSMPQQYEAGKLGMWIFLATETLLFGGLFCAYAIYRSAHSEVFVFAHQFLDKSLGGINTAVLICSSLTMAWAVRCAERDRQRGLKVLLVVTLLFATCFLGIKFVEYEHKWRHGLLWARDFRPHGIAGMPSIAPVALPVVPGPAGTRATSTTRAAGQLPAAPQTQASPTRSMGSDAAWPTVSSQVAPTSPGLRPATTTATASTQASASSDRPLIKPAAEGPRGLAAGALESQMPSRWPSAARTFFSIYFLLTGLHGLHVIAGMSAITWLLVRACKGHFSSGYFGPVDSVGLYWHLVDIIWIYLFPLLYLIH